MKLVMQSTVGKRFEVFSYKDSPDEPGKKLATFALDGNVAFEGNLSSEEKESVMDLVTRQTSLM